MIEQGTSAGIYNTGSENSLFNAVPNNAAYLATKHAVLGLTRQPPGADAGFHSCRTDHSGIA